MHSWGVRLTWFDCNEKKIVKLCVHCLRYSKFGQQILANYVASSSPRSVITVTQPFFFKNQKCGKDFVPGFAKNDHESLYRRILTKYKSSKLF